MVITGLALSRFQIVASLPTKDAIKRMRNRATLQLTCDFVYSDEDQAQVTKKQVKNMESHSRQQKRRIKAENFKEINSLSL